MWGERAVYFLQTGGPGMGLPCPSHFNPVWFSFLILCAVNRKDTGAVTQAASGRGGGPVYLSPLTVVVLSNSVPCGLSVNSLSSSFVFLFSFFSFFLPHIGDDAGRSRGGLNLPSRESFSKLVLHLWATVWGLGQRRARSKDWGLNLTKNWESLPTALQEDGRCPHFKRWEMD